MEGCIESEVFHKGPQDYIMPGPDLEYYYKHSRLPNSVVEVLDSQFRLTYGSVVDFHNRLGVIENLTNKKIERITNSFRNIPKIIQSHYEGVINETILKYDLLERFVIPDIAWTFLDYPWQKGRWRIITWLQMAEKLIPIIHKWSIMNSKVQLGDVELEKEIQEMIYGVQFQAKKALRQQEKISQWFNTNMDRIYEHNGGTG